MVSGNVFIELLKSSVNYAKDDTKGFVRDFTSEVRKQVVAKGAKAVATIIVSSSGGLLLTLAARETLGFEWITKVLEFLKLVYERSL